MGITIAALENEQCGAFSAARSDTSERHPSTKSPIGIDDGSAPARPGIAAVAHVLHRGDKALTAYAHMTSEMEAQRAAHAKSRALVVEVERGVVGRHWPGKSNLILSYSSLFFHNRDGGLLSNLRLKPRNLLRLL